MPGFVSPVGKKQIERGLRKCDPAAITSFRDPLFAPTATYEMAVLVKLMQWASVRLNKKFELDGKGKGEGKGEGEGEGEREGESDFRKRAKWAKELDKTFRINLRFLADIRNVCLVVIILKVLF